MTWYTWYHSFDFLLLDFPAYHLLMLILVLVCVGFLWGIYVHVRFICQLIGTCPACHKNCLHTKQQCLACGFIRTHANDLPGR